MLAAGDYPEASDRGTPIDGVADAEATGALVFQAGTALHDGIKWAWETFPEYLDALDTTPTSLDVAALAPHGAIRAYVMGDRGARNEQRGDRRGESRTAERGATTRGGEVVHGWSSGIGRRAEWVASSGGRARRPLQ